MQGIHFINPLHTAKFHHFISPGDMGFFLCHLKDKADIAGELFFILNDKTRTQKGDCHM